MSSALRSFSHAPSARTGSGLGTTSLHREQPTYSGYGGGSRYAGASTSGYNSSASTNGISYGSAGIGGVLPRGRTTAPMDDRAPMAGNATLTRTNHSASLAAMTPGAQRPALFDTTVSSAYGGSHTVPRARAASPAVGSRPLPSYTAPTADYRQPTASIAPGAVHGRRSIPTYDFEYDPVATSNTSSYSTVPTRTPPLPHLDQPRARGTETADYYAGSSSSNNASPTFSGSGSSSFSLDHDRGAGSVGAGNGAGSGRDGGGYGGGSSSSSLALPAGFRNLGNTCYMNSALQCVLFGSGGFVRALRTTPILHNMGSVTPPRLRSSATSSGGSPMSLTQALLGLAEGAGSSSALLNVKSGVSRMNSEFLGARQNDSHEFIRELLHGVHKEINRVEGKPKYVEMKDLPGEQDVDAARRWIAYSKTHDNSLVYDHFGGFLRSVTKCSACQNRSFVFDPFLDLSLPTAPTLMQALFNLNATESVQILKCDACKKKNVDGLRQTVVVEWPRTLVIHLKRFSSSGRKDTSNVVYPIRITQEDSASAGLVMPRNVTLPSRGYTLSGVVLHQGTMGFGHYIAYVRRGSTWYECDDSTITKINEATVLKAQSAAYLLFYTSED
jgi:ubiquitin C-terminal hydrolase